MPMAHRICELFRGELCLGASHFIYIWVRGVQTARVAQLAITSVAGQQDLCATTSGDWTSLFDAPVRRIALEDTIAMITKREIPDHSMERNAADCTWNSCG